MRQLTFLFILAVINIVSFQNCGQDFAVRRDLNLASFSAGSSCESQLQPAFEASYGSFLSSTCVACHVPGGPGKGAFAQSNSSAAFSAFLLATSDRIDTLAVSSSHASPFTGTQNQTAINTASATWNQAVAACKAGTGGGGSEDSGVVTMPKVMDATATNKDITWNLDTEVASGGGGTGGATFTVAVRKVTAAGYTTYFFNTPRLKAGSKPLHIEDIMIKINGQTQTLGTTWIMANADVAANATVTLATSQLFLEYVDSASDTLAISIGVLETR